MTKLTAKAAGTFAIAPTPFHDDGRIDEKSIDRLTDFYAEVGCDGVTVLGILGEAPKLDGSSASPRRDSPRCARWRAPRWMRVRPG
jgi:4-hydroxy-tetrahydrodipicolinate synthase